VRPRNLTLAAAATLAVAAPALASFTGAAQNTGNAARAAEVFAPVSVADPSIVGLARLGQTLTADPGRFAGEPATLAYRWSRCDAAGEACQAIAQATRSAYVVGTADIGRRLRVEVTSHNAAGSDVATSAASEGVPPEPKRPASAGPLPLRPAGVGWDVSTGDPAWTLNPALPTVLARF